jgi:hypothetical protein
VSFHDFSVVEFESQAGEAMYALTWRCDGSEGIKWFLRGLLEDGSFYGEIRFQSPVAERRRASWVSGRMSPTEAAAMAALIGRIRRAAPPSGAGPRFAAFFERVPGASDARRLFEYHRGDEDHSDPALAFVELVGLLERHLEPFARRIA